MQKNTASQAVIAKAYHSKTGAIESGDSGNFTTLVSKDGANTGASAGSWAEIDSSGFYTYTPTQGETDCDVFHLQTSSSTTDIIVEDVVIYTSIEDSLEAQVGSIASASGGALNFEAEDDNVGGAIKTISFVGVETSGTFASTEAEDGTYHQIDDTTNEIDIIYQYDVGGNRTASEVTFKGYLNGNNDAVNIQAYDYVGTDWETRLVLNGQAGSSNVTETITLLSKHTGTSGADIGKVLIRIHGSAQSNPTLYVDSLLVAGVSLAQSVGYANGAVWVDTNNGVAGTENYVNGTADNPVSTWADALTISASLNLTRFVLTANSSITLSANSDNYYIDARGSTVALGGQSVSGTVIDGAIITGNDDGSNAVVTTYLSCVMGTNTLGLHCFIECGISADITFAEASTNDWIRCYSRVAGTSTPSVDVGAAIANTNFNMRAYSGGIEIKNFGGTGSDAMSLEGTGQLVINANCSGGTIAIRGNFTVTDNAGGAVTLSDDARIDVAQINAECDTALTDYAPATAAICTEARLAELDAANLPADVDLILADTNELQTDWVNSGRLDTILDRIDSETTDILNDTNAILIDTATTIPATITAVKGDTAAILLDTGELQVDWVDGGRLDLILDAILVDTATTIPASITAMRTNVDAILVDTLSLTDGTIVDGYTIAAALQIIAAAVSGRISGAGTGTEVFLGIDESTTRLTVTVDEDGNRSDVVYV